MKKLIILIIFLTVVINVTDGQVKFEKVYGGSGYEYGYDVIQAADGGYLVAGVTTTTGAGASDGFILKVDSLGSPRVIRASTDGAQISVPITEFTYDLSSSAGQGAFTFTFSRGL